MTAPLTDEQLAAIDRAPDSTGAKRLLAEVRRLRAENDALRFELALRALPADVAVVLPPEATMEHLAITE